MIIENNVDILKRRYDCQKSTVIRLVKTEG